MLTFLRRLCSVLSGDTLRAHGYHPGKRAFRDIDGRTLVRALRNELAGTPADDGARPSAIGARGSVVWVDDGDELLVHLDTLAVRFSTDGIRVELAVEADDIARSSVIVTLALGSNPRPDTVLAVAGDRPCGDELVIGRWGAVLEHAVWAAIVSAAEREARFLGHAVLGISVQAGHLRVGLGAPVRQESAVGAS